MKENDSAALGPITKDDIQRVHFENRESEDLARPSLTYWQDVRLRFARNKLAMVGAVLIALMLLFAIFGYLFVDNDYYTQDLSMTNLPPRLRCFVMDDETLLYVSPEYGLYSVGADGTIRAKETPQEENMAQRRRTYLIDGRTVVVDNSNAAVIAKARRAGDMRTANSLKPFQVLVDGAEPPTRTVRNKLYILGSDYLGRDMWARLVYGARISLLVALIATLAQFFIGVLYGGIAGYMGGRVDNIMMRAVDIISTVPLTLYVVLLMVLMGPGIKTIIIALGSVYWVDMARQVRGHVLEVKGQEFILAARTIGATPARLMVRHLIPNAMSTIIVTLTMNIPSAIFTESFLSFIGLGVSAPAASWGTLASDALGGLRSYPYQLFLPSLCICVTVLGFNFLGDGLRDALDPKLRK